MSSHVAAASHPSIGRPLHRYRQSAAVFLGAGVLAFTIGYVALWVAGFPDDGPASTIAVWMFGGGIVPIIIGVGALARSLRMAAYCRRYPWQSLVVRHELITWGGAGTPALALGADGEHVLLLIAIKPRWGVFSGLDSVLFAGDLDHKGVLATPDGERLAWVRRSRSAWYRRRLQRTVATLDGPPPEPGAATDPPS